MAIKNIEELFAYDGRDFIIAVYQNLLEREPDEHGLMYYLGRLAQGYSKVDVIAQLAKSPECRSLDEIVGFRKLIIDDQRSKKWFRRWFNRSSQIEGAVYTGTMKLAQMDSHLTCTNQHLATLQEALLLATNEQKQQIKELMQQFSQMHINSSVVDQIQNKQTRLSPETVRQAFAAILGREPESQEAINCHTTFESHQALRENIMHSDEFQAKLEGLPEYARQLFQYQIQITNAQYGE